MLKNFAQQQGGNLQKAMRALPRTRLLLLSALTGGVALIAAAVAIVNPEVTRYVESDAFCGELDKQRALRSDQEDRFSHGDD